MLLYCDTNLVRMADGTELPVGEIKLGDAVKGLGGPNNVIGVRHTRSHGQVVDLNGDIMLTVEQPVMSSGNVWLALDRASAQTEHIRLTILPINKDVRFKYKRPKGEKQYQGVTKFGESEELVCVQLELDGDHTFVCNDYYLHNKGDKPAPAPSSTTSTTEPPAYLKPYLTDIAGKAQDAFGNVPEGGFGGDFIAPQTEGQKVSLAGQNQVGANLATQNFGSGTSASADLLQNRVNSGDYLAAANNQYATQNLATPELINSYLQPVQDNLQQNIIPQVQSKAIQDGAYGGSRFDVTLADQIQNNYTDEATRIATQLGYQDQVRQDAQGFENFTLNQKLLPELFGAEQRGAALAPELANTGVSQSLLASEITGTAGDRQQLFDQQGLDEAYQQYVNSVNTPYAGLDQYASLIYGQPAGGTSHTTGMSGGAVSSGGGAGGIGGALSGGMAGISMGSMLGLAPLGPAGIGLGIGGALLGGLF